VDTFHIHIEGIVQGVGFRPFVYQLATHRGLVGWVNNTNDGLHIEISALQDKAEAFYQHIIRHPPKLATITRHEIQKSSYQEFTQFAIIESDSGSNPSLPLTPDFALCEDCRSEISNANDRRYEYAFTTCTNCGPRYSIITSLPYDRPNTMMADFEQCDECRAEYNNPLNRRHFSQTNSCPNCGISIMMHDEQLADEEISQIANYLDKGKILAIKGIGGFLLMCNAANREVIERLRERKNRPTKPFAVMYPNMEMIKADLQVSEEEEALFLDEVSPIVLLKPISDKLQINAESIAPGLNHIGCMLPYAPLFHLLLQQYQKPVIATSGNVSGSPIIYQNTEAHAELKDIADVIITNNRHIVIPQDDSVIKFSDQHRQKVILRRSRGLAPTFLHPGINLAHKNILAVGAQMKSSFAFTNKGQLYISQYLGDMDNYLTQNHYEHTINHFFQVFKAQPQIIIGDKHPDYFSTHYGLALAARLNVPFVPVQHHEAHFYAVLAENKLLNQPEEVLGVIWDGTGYGDDGEIWGGEFFLYKDGQAKRVAHIPYFPFILANKMPREPRVSALAFGSLSNDNKNPEELRNKFSKAEWSVYQRMLAEPPLRTSSMGRVFDAMASIILDIDKTSFEGEAAMMLEAAASAYFSTKTIKEVNRYDIQSTEGKNHFSNLFNLVMEDKNNGITNSEIAAKFHLSLVNLIRQEAEKQGVKKIAFSGGVFQNSLLIDLIKTILATDFELIFHQRLSSNDENISFGQLAYFTMHEKNLIT
jgi:hydrogenase maturation protein HypF